MQALKILVVVMGIMIIAGTVTLAVVIAQRLSGSGAGARGFAEQTLTVPDGARVVAAVPGDGHVAVQIELPDGSTRVELIDMRTGRSTGAVAIAPAAAR